MSGDKIFSSVVFLAHLTGGNYVDFSQANKQLTKIGNVASQEIDTGFGAMACAYFDGAGDWLQCTSGLSDLAFGLNSFAIECCIKCEPTTTDKVIIDFYTNGSSTWQLFLSAGKVAFYQSNPNATAIIGVTRVDDNKVHFLQVCRYLGILYVLVDGNLEASIANTKNHSFISTTFAIGAQVSTRNSAYDFKGYIFNVRITNNVRNASSYTIERKLFDKGADAAYAKVHIPFSGQNNTNIFKNTPFIADTDIVNPLPIPVKTGSPIISTAVSNPFGELSGVGYFNASSSIAAQENCSYGAFGTGDFTISGWIRHIPAISPGYQRIAETQGFSGGTKSGWALVIALTSNKLLFHFGDGAQIIISPSGLIQNLWTHFAVVRSGNTIYMFINGFLVATAAISANFLEKKLSIGGNVFGGEFLNAYLSDFCINNFAEYSGNFIPRKRMPPSITINGGEKYLMMAWDPDNLRFCQWDTQFPLAAPSSTTPASIVGNLQNSHVVTKL